MKILVRKAEKDDFECIQNLNLEIERVECSFDSNLVCDTYLLKDGIKTLNEDLKNENIYFLVAVVDDKIVGFIDGEIQDKYYYKEKIAYIGHLCVDKNYRNNGIAQKLFDEFVKLVKNKGAIFVKLNAFPKNNPAINFYLKNGFSEYSVLYQRRI